MAACLLASSKLLDPDLNPALQDMHYRLQVTRVVSLVHPGGAGTRITLEQAAPVRLLAASVSFRLSQVCSLNTLAAALLTLDSPILRPQPCLTVAK